MLFPPETDLVCVNGLAATARTFNTGDLIDEDIQIWDTPPFAFVGVDIKGQMAKSAGRIMHESSSARSLVLFRRLIF